jgi:archaeosine synthase beta-subunit
MADGHSTTAGAVMTTVPFDQIATLDEDGPLRRAQYHPFISRVMRKLHSRIPREHYVLSKVPTPVDYREEYFEDRNCRRAVLFLLTNGCEWAIKGAHGCTMCGHLAKQTMSETPLSPGDIISQFMGEFEKIDFRETPILNLYNNGSFFNDHELQAGARKRILSEINNQKLIRMLVVESRPEFISDGSMAEMRSLVPDIRVEVAMGIETMDDLKRMISINKGFTLRQYDEAIRKIRKHGLHPRSYVLIKPPFFSEREGIEEAIKTAAHVFNAGAATVSLEACTYQKYTLTSYLVDSGLYRLTKLWSILEVLKKTHGLGRVLVGLFQFFPSPEHVPYNCPRCSRPVLEALKEYNRTLRAEALEGLDCDCRKDWEDELRLNHETYHDRLKAFRARAIEDKIVEF